MIKLNIDVTKIPKERIKSKPEWKGKFLDVVLVDKPDDRGNAGFIAVEVSKEERQSGARGEIIGNWRYIGSNNQQQASGSRQDQRRPQGKPTPPRDVDLDPESDDLDF
jgi:hypothetical protein